MKIHHLNCVKIESAFGSAIGHCLLIENNKNLTLIDSGIGLAETKEPVKRLGKELVEITGFKFDESLTAIKQIENLGLNPSNVSNIICSHLDPDHIGGLADFPDSRVHVSEEEYNSFRNGNERYLNQQLSYNSKIVLYKVDDSEWFGLPARKLSLDFEIYLIPLFGHTLGHCGIAFHTGNRWMFYVGDAYYLRAELTDKDHTVDQLATIRAVNDDMRRQSLEKIRKIIENYGNEIEYFGYHDPSEFKENAIGNIA